ncbi:MAG: hypothetical protein DELT_01974 [Desulfovibrio sp.]
MCETSFVCIRCAAVNPTCCKTVPANRANCFPLSSAEEARLAPHAAKLGVPSHEVEENTPDFTRLMRALFPDTRKAVFKEFPEGGTHMRLPLRENGECCFLQEDGCVLPRDARPWYCQLFPIWVRNGFFDRFTPEECLLTHEAKKLGDVFTALGMSREHATALYRALCRDWGMEKHDE